MGFISEPIRVEYDVPPDLEKAPHRPPDRFSWRGATFTVTDTLDAHTQFDRSGRMSENMQPGHLATAARRGSWGVGRYRFVVRTACDRRFELYYDRAPSISGGRRKGGWFLYRELENPGSRLECPPGVES